MDLSAWPIAIADFFAALSVETPLMLIINDAHRADVESVAMLETLAHRVATSHILFVITYRIDEAPNAQLKHLMQSLLNAKLARAVSVAASYADEGRLLFESAFGRALRPDKVGSSLDDDARHLIHGLLVVEMCRRTGRWSDALAVAERVVKASELHEAPYLFYSATIAIGHILADQGKWDESLKRLEQIQSDVEKSKENTLIAWLYWGIARVYWAKSARKTAFKMLRLARTVAERISDPTLRASIALCGVEWLADNKRLQPARDWLAWLEQIASQSDNAASDAPLAAANGIIAIAQKDPISATGFFRSALRLWSLIGNAYTVAHAHMRLSAALLPRDDAESRREGREELVEAHSAFTRLGATCDVNTVEELGEQYGVRPRARRAASGRSASPGGITPREREVLGLLVQGMTNRQIATELSITEKTAEGHVSNILAKLGVASRGQAAGYAVANGLLEGAEA